MTAEVPDMAMRGEQIGVRLCIFNNWDEDIEVRAWAGDRKYVFRQVRKHCACFTKSMFYLIIFDDVFFSP
jgi:hypothetical protein